MSISFSERPGRHERHYRRKLANALFVDAPAEAEDDTLLAMQRLDHDELLAFLAELRTTLQRAVDLEAGAGSEAVLDIKERLDRLYEMSAGLAEDHADNQAAIIRLLDVIMRSVERGAADDPQALDELARERLAREAHFALLSQPLVADLLHPQSCIAAAELAPTLLSAEPGELDAALQLFDHEQLVQLHEQARQCLAACPSAPHTAVAGLERIAQQLSRVRQAGALN